MERGNARFEWQRRREFSPAAFFRRLAFPVVLENFEKFPIFLFTNVFFRAIVKSLYYLEGGCPHIYQYRFKNKNISANYSVYRHCQQRRCRDCVYGRRIYGIGHRHPCSFRHYYSRWRVLLSWISSWLLYGFGELIEKTTEIAKNTANFTLAEKKTGSSGEHSMGTYSQNKSVDAEKPVEEPYDPLTQYRCICTKINDLNSEKCYYCGRPTKMVLNMIKKRSN